MAQKIILLEDDPDIAWLVQLQLERAGYNVHTACDGNSGLCEFLNAGADLLLLDIDLPGISGWDVYARVRERSAIPIIMLTAYPQQQNGLPQSFGRSNDGYISKPFTFPQLLESIQTLIRVNEDASIPTKLSPKPDSYLTYR